MKVNKNIDKLVKCHNRLVQAADLPDHLFIRNMSGGFIRVANNCLKSISKSNDENEVSINNIVNYCVYNINRLSQMSSSAISIFKYNHIFGATGIKRYKESPSGSRYYEDIFLSTHGVTRGELILMISDVDKHPLFNYIYPKYEDMVKRRLFNTAAGRLLCERSTTLYAPKSPYCSTCNYAESCKDRLKEFNNELHRLRTTEI